MFKAETYDSEVGKKSNFFLLIKCKRVKIGVNQQCEGMEYTCTKILIMGMYIML